MAKKSGLGSKLDSIFDEDVSVFGDDEKSISVMKLSDIEPNKEQPRKNFDQEALNALAESILEHGIIQPLTVRALDNGSYQIVAGERRWRAAKIAGLRDVPVRVMELTDEQTAQIALIENLQREDLNLIEEATGYQQLISAYGMKQDEVAKKVGKARSSVTNALRLLELPDEIKDLVEKNKLTQGHCKALLSLTDNQQQITLANKVIRDGISVRMLEKTVAQMNVPKKQMPRKKASFFTEAEINLSNRIGKPVRITAANNRIKLEIDCKDEDELKELLHTIAGE